MELNIKKKSDENMKKKLSAIKERVKLLLESQKLADVHFLIGKPPMDQLLPGHKLILALSSPIFEEMFYGENPLNVDLIHVPDLVPEAFKIMLEYIYSDRKKFNGIEQAIQVYCAARKYMLTNLMESCIMYLMTKLKPSIACLVYEFAKLFDEKVLMDTSMQIIVTSTKDVLQHENFLNIAPETLLDVLEQERLNMDSELELFEAVQRYANVRVFSGNSSSDISNKDQENEMQEEEEINNLETNGAQEDRQTNQDKISVNIVPLLETIKVEKDLQVEEGELLENIEEDEGVNSAGSSFASSDPNDSANISSGNMENQLYNKNAVCFQTHSDALTETQNLFCNESVIPNTQENLINTNSSSATANPVSESVEHAPSINEISENNQNSTLNTASTQNNVAIPNNVAGDLNQNVTSKNKEEKTLNEAVQDILNMKQNPVSEHIIHQAVKKIRFLTFTPEEFVKGPALSKLLKRDEAFSILINIINPKVEECPLPEGFCSY